MPAGREAAGTSGRPPAGREAAGTSGPRPASQPAAVIAQTDCKLLSLDRQSVFGVLNRQGHALDELRRLADQRLRTYTDTAVQASWGMLLEEATIVGVYSPKGGSGGTCLALNLVGAP